MRAQAGKCRRKKWLHKSTSRLDIVRVKIPELPGEGLNTLL
jgi:hypothetical protein